MCLIAYLTEKPFFLLWHSRWAVYWSISALMQEKNHYPGLTFKLRLAWRSPAKLQTAKAALELRCNTRPSPNTNSPLFKGDHTEMEARCKPKISGAPGKGVSLQNSHFQGSNWVVWAKTIGKIGLKARALRYFAKFSDFVKSVPKSI